MYTLECSLLITISLLSLYLPVSLSLYFSSYIFIHNIIILGMCICMRTYVCTYMERFVCEHIYYLLQPHAY